MAYEKEVQDFTAQGTDLPESKLSTGFIAGERPPANWFNSLFSRITQAIKELQSKSAEKENVLLKDNTEEFTPTEDYQPVTKKYVDDKKITVDSELSDTSENPVQNKVVKKALEDIPSTLTFDSALSTTSTNAVQNKVITQKINNLPKRKVISDAIPETGWSTTAPYYVDLDYPDVTMATTAHVTVEYLIANDFEDIKAIEEEWNKIDRIVTMAGKVRIYAFEEIPTRLIPIQIEFFS